MTTKSTLRLQDQRYSGISWLLAGCTIAMIASFGNSVCKSKTIENHACMLACWHALDHQRAKQQVKQIVISCSMAVLCVQVSPSQSRLHARLLLLGRRRLVAWQRWAHLVSDSPPNSSDVKYLPISSLPSRVHVLASLSSMDSPACCAMAITDTSTVAIFTH
jgi:hypothetical protein